MYRYTLKIPSSYHLLALFLIQKEMYFKQRGTYLQAASVLVNIGNNYNIKNVKLFASGQCTHKDQHLLFVFHC